MGAYSTAAPWDTLTGEQRHRWTTVLAHLTAAIPAGAPLVLVDGADPCAALLADRLATALRDTGRGCVRFTNTTCVTHEDAWRGRRGADTVVIADGPRWREHLPPGGWHLTIWARTPTTDGACRGGQVDIVVDLHDPAWPVIRQLDWWFANEQSWYRTE